MKTLFCISFHIVFNAVFGICVLLYQKEKKDRSFLETLLIGTLLGWLLETTLTATLLFAKIPFKTAYGVSLLLITVFIFATVKLKRKDIRFIFPKLWPLRWYEWLVGISIAEKLFFILWQLTSVKIWGDDALTHWAGRGRCLYGGVNWSLDPKSPVFLGNTGYANNYPIATPIWRAVTAGLNGGWNDVIAQSDSLLFFVLSLAAVWMIVYRLSKERYLAAGAAFVAAALPYHVWHGAIGYNDIGVEAMMMASLLCYFGEEWFLAGIFIAGCGWIKNEGLVIYATAFLLGCVVQWMAFLKQGASEIKQAIIKRFSWFISGFLMIIAPRILFVFFYKQNLRTSGVESGFSFHGEAFKTFFDFVIIGPTHNIFWILTPLVIGTCFFNLKMDPRGKFLITFFIAAVLGLIFVYFFTGAFEASFANQTAIHRSMLQIYGLSVVTMAYGCWLGIEKQRVLPAASKKAPSKRN